METITIYVAEDGTKFDDERECIDYEDKMLIQKLYDLGMRFYDCDFKQIEKENIVESKDIVYIYIPSEETYNLFDSAVDKYLFDIEIVYTNDGYYYYNPIADYYESLEGKLKHLLYVKKSLEGA